jgi:hypothetical protein
LSIHGILETGAGSAPSLEALKTEPSETLAKSRAFKVTLKCWIIHTSFAKRRTTNTAVVAMVMPSNREPNKQTLLLCVPIAVKGNCAGFTNPVIRVVFQ